MNTRKIYWHEKSLGERYFVMIIRTRQMQTMWSIQVVNHSMRLRITGVMHIPTAR